MIIDKVIELLADQLDMNKNEINENTTFEDLGVDSLDAVEITMEMEDEFGVSFIRYAGDCFGENDNLPATIYFVPYNTKEADSLVDKNEDMNWIDAIVQVSKWDEAVEVNLSKK